MTDPQMPNPMRDETYGLVFHYAVAQVENDYKFDRDIPDAPEVPDD